MAFFLTIIIRIKVLKNNLLGNIILESENTFDFSNTTQNLNFYSKYKIPENN